MVRTAVLLLVLGVISGAFAACGADDDDAAPAGTNGGAGIGGSAGTTSGTGGMAPAGSGSAGTTAAGSAGSMTMPGMDFVPGSATFKAVYKEVFVDTGCSGGAYCHGGGALTGGLDMTDRAKTYTELINVPANAMNLPPVMGVEDCMAKGKMGVMRVVPGNPDASLLMNKITQATPMCGKGMPPTGMIDAAKIAQVRMWIMNGAHDD